MQARNRLTQVDQKTAVKTEEEIIPSNITSIPWLCFCCCCRRRRCCRCRYGRYASLCQRGIALCRGPFRLSVSLSQIRSPIKTAKQSPQQQRRVIASDHQFTHTIPRELYKADAQFIYALSTDIITDDIWRPSCPQIIPVFTVLPSYLQKGSSPQASYTVSALRYRTTSKLG